MHQSKILVADDSRASRAQVRRALSAAGYDVTLAADGREAVQFARRDRPDLVILDIQMPEMDGYTACDEILALADGASNPRIIFLTKVAAKHLGSLGSELGAYLRKPVTDQQLVQTVETLLAGSNEPDHCAGTKE